MDVDFNSSSAVDEVLRVRGCLRLVRWEDCWTTRAYVLKHHPSMLGEQQTLQPLSRVGRRIPPMIVQSPDASTLEQVQSVLGPLDSPLFNSFVVAACDSLELLRAEEDPLNDGEYFSWVKEWLDRTGDQRALARFACCWGASAIRPFHDHLLARIAEEQGGNVPTWRNQHRGKVLEEKEGMCLCQWEDSWVHESSVV